MRLPPRDKQTLYHNLAQLLRAGIPLPTALEKLEATTHGGLHRLIQRLRKALAEGHPAGEAFASCPSISELESSVIGAVDHGGRLDFGLQQLALYFEVIAQAGETILRKAAYPFFILHFGIFTLPLPKLLKEGVGAYFSEVIAFLAVLYAVVLIVYLLLPVVSEIGTRNPLSDRLLRMLPLVGKVRSHFAHARFCMVYDIQLGAGVNVMGALESASTASQSGLVKSAIAKILPELRTGQQVGPLLARSGIFPRAMTRSLIIGEESGELDRELQRMSGEFEAKALQALKATAMVISMILYMAVVFYLGWRIVSSYQESFKEMDKILDMSK